MPQTIYLPKQQYPMMNQMTNFLWQLAMTKARHKLDMEEAEKSIREEGRRYKEGQKKEERVYEEKQKKEERTYKETHPTPSTAAKNYRIAQRQFILGKGPNPGSFMQYQERMKKASATRITFEEKLGLHEAKKGVDAKMAVKSTKHQNTVIARLKSKFGPEWQDLSEYTKSELIFQETHKDVLETFPGAVFDDRRGGWYNPKSGKLIKPYKGWVPEPKEQIMDKARRATEFRPY
ncbi:MAG: hypothetical protein ACYTBP_17580 [Planctomycetota bacterium]|jgi:hypothetical protein